MRIPTRTKMFRRQSLKKDVSPSGSMLTPSVSSNSTNSSGSSSISLLREDLEAEAEFRVVRTLAEGSFSKILLATMKKDPESSKVVIKARELSGISVEDFNREVELTYLLSPHPNVVTCYNVTFLWQHSFCFLEEYALYGSLQKYLQRRRSSNKVALGEQRTKLICTQIASALEFMHQLNLVHCQLTPEHILVFKGNLSIVKLADFSSSRSSGSLVVFKDKDKTKQNSFYTPPELSDLLRGEKYHVSPGHDIWALGILIFYLMMGKGPWTSADALSDPDYRHYCYWLKRKSLKLPENFKNLSPRFIRLFKRLCEPKESQRSGVREVRKYLKDPWILKKRPCPSSRLETEEFESYSTERRTSDVSTECTTAGDNTEEPIVPGQSTNIRKELKELNASLKTLGLEEVDKNKTLEEWVQNATTPLINL